MREQLNRPQMGQGSRGVGGIPTVLWCRWVRFSDPLSWLELRNLIIALAQLAFRANRSPGSMAVSFQEIFCEVLAAPLCSTSCSLAIG